MNFEPRRSHDEGPQDEEQEQFAHAFCELGGVEVMLHWWSYGWRGNYYFSLLLLGHNM